MASASLPQELTEGTEAVEHFTYNNVEDERSRTFSHASVLKLSGSVAVSRTVVVFLASTGPFCCSPEETFPPSWAFWALVEGRQRRGNLAEVPL
jgi:hypothetical protein